MPISRDFEKYHLVTLLDTISRGRIIKQKSIPFFNEIVEEKSLNLAFIWLFSMNLSSVTV